MMYRYKKIQVSIKQYLDMMITRGQLPQIDVQPVGQRLDVEPRLEGPGDKHSKSQAIISSILKGVDIGQLTVHESDGEFVYVSIDGGHRMRAILAYAKGEFRVNGKYYYELTKEEQEYFENTEMIFCIYSDLTVWDIGYIFRSLNETTQVNHQEMLNSYGDHPIANAVRGIVRRVRDFDTRPHRLFDSVQSDQHSLPKYTYLQFDNNRLNLEEHVARLYCRYYDGGVFGDAGDKALERLYEVDLSEEEVSRLTAKVTKCLDFLEEIAYVRKQRNNGVGLSQREYSLYSRLWMWMEETFGTFKVNDLPKFYDTTSSVAAEFFKPEAAYDDELKEPSQFDANKTKGKQFNSTLGEHGKSAKNRKAIKVCLEWFTERLDMAELVTLKDPKRLFSREWRELKLAEQGFKCAIDGEPLTMEDAQGGHIIPHTRGGRTTYDNLVMITAEHNRKMGSMTLDEYIRSLEVAA